MKKIRNVTQKITIWPILIISVALSLLVNVSCIKKTLSVPVITSTLTASGKADSAFTYTITASGSPIGFGATPLPAGLSVNNLTGVISGKPTDGGTFNVTISATNTTADLGPVKGSATLVITIVPQVPVIISALTKSGNVGSAFSYTITASGSPTSFSATPLPAGLSVDITTGVISGTPTTAASTNVTISATNISGTGTATLAITIAQIPVLTTVAISNITQTTSSSGGNITSDGGATVTARGVCWGTGQTPTTADSKTTDGAGTGSFTSAITGLTANTVYYARAYATNVVGTGYGSAISFTTQQESTTTVTDIDGNVYPIITIGTQVWMAANLKTTKYRDGSDIATELDNAAWMNLTTGAYCDYDNSADNGVIYGKLYNWYAVNDSRNIAPTGWHVPTNDEWTTLINFVGGPSVAGGALKETGFTHWIDPNAGATNVSGFTALPGSKRDGSGFGGIGQISFWWTSTESTSTKGYHRMTFNWMQTEETDDSGKNYGMSVRCVKD